MRMAAMLRRYIVAMIARLKVERERVLGGLVGLGQSCASLMQGRGTANLIVEQKVTCMIRWGFQINIAQQAEPLDRRTYLSRIV
jgi:hypothetical protein